MSSYHLPNFGIIDNARSNFGSKQNHYLRRFGGGLQTRSNRGSTFRRCQCVGQCAQCPTGQCELLTLLGQAIRPCRRPDKLSPNVSAGHPFAPLDGHHHRHPRLCTNQCTKGARSVTIYCPCLPAPSDSLISVSLLWTVQSDLVLSSPV